jgi:hypothetical protein
MRRFAQLAKSGAGHPHRAYGRSTPNYQSSVPVGVRRESAGHTPELGLVGPVALFHTTARGALPRCIARIDKCQGNTRQRSLVRNKSEQLVEGPTVENYSLLASANRIHAVPNTRKVFEFQTALRAFGASNDLLAYNVVRVVGRSVAPCPKVSSACVSRRGFASFAASGAGGDGGSERS